MIITYVDDLFYLSTLEVIEAIHSWIQADWPCSGLEWANTKEGTRYLGMTVRQGEDGAVEISQEGYILDLLRVHDMEQTHGAKLPCPKEWILDADGDDETLENYTEEELKHAQRVVGEQFWLAMRTRPDILFVVNYMASQVSKQPSKVARVGRRVLTYLRSTSGLTLRVAPLGAGTSTTTKGSTSSSSSLTTDGTNKSTAAAPKKHEHARVRLVGFSDASYAPTGGRSFGASVVTVNDVPVSWKAGKQSVVTLSVMEAELYEASQASVLLEHVGVLLDELTGFRVARVLMVGVVEKATS